MTRVGVCTEGRGMLLRSEEGNRIPLAPLGYEHDFA